MSELPFGLCFDLEYYRGTWEARLQADDNIDVRVEVPPELADEFLRRKWEVDKMMKMLRDERQLIIHEFMEKVWEMVEG